MKNMNEKLRKVLSRIESSDPKLSEELQEVRHADKFVNEAHTISPKLKEDQPELAGGGLETLTDGMADTALETIVLRVGRPVLTVSKNDVVMEFRDAESEVWRERLIKSRSEITAAIKSVGRIELQHHPFFSWVGTGWLVDKNTVVTNRHVAEVFSRNREQEFTFRMGSGGNAMKASIDFLEEADRPEDFTFRLFSILHVEDDDGPDMAFLRVEAASGKALPAPISLALFGVHEDLDVSVIGYPARDSRIPDQQLMIDIFGDVFDKKRLAPGKLIGVSESEILHDCSTLGGNSGSVVLDLLSGQAVGLHFAGRFLESNFAVPALLIRQRLESLGAEKKSPRSPSPDKSNKPSMQNSTSPDDTRAKASPAAATLPATLNFNIPVQLTVLLGSPVVVTGGGSGNAGASTAVSGNGKFTSPSGPQAIREEDERFITEGVPEDYNDREGYSPTFLGKKAKVPLPEITKKKTDILSFELDGGKQKELKYTHFSVLMSKSRRMCFFSAVNIDGNTSVGMKRGPWRLDPRIAPEEQIMKECYGNPPKFSRGHMTRREDPIWGDEFSAKQGNDDSMHVTNAVPQMQSMNAGIWLGLENYALHNARQDEMRISVFTGPVFRNDDPVRFGVKVPVSFWKVIVFIHDETRKLCATGYTMSQEDFIEEEEFVFGQHKTSQVSIASIEKLTGLSFNGLADIDPMSKTTEAAENILLDLEQIRFV